MALEEKPHQCSTSTTAVAKRDDTYTKPTEKEKETQKIPAGYVTFLTFFLIFLHEEASAGCQGIGKYNQRFLKVAEEGGLEEEGHF